MKALLQKDILSTHEGRLLYNAIADRLISTFIEHPSHIEWTKSSIVNLKRLTIFSFRSLAKSLYYLFLVKSTRFINPFALLIYIIQAFKIYRSFSNCNSAYIHAGHDITNVVIDTRIRFSSFPSYNRSLVDLYYICSYLQAYDFAHSRIKALNPKFSIALYACYSQHLGFINACIDTGTPTYFAFRGNLFLSILNQSYPHHSIDYSHVFSSRQNLKHEQLLYMDEVSTKVLALRKSGVNMGQSYMKKTAFGGFSLTEETINTISSSIILFLHDFYDSPHIYPGLDFADFVDWTIDTIKFLISTGKKIYIKPHPNQISPSSPVSKLILSIFPQVNVLDARASNHDIFTAKPALIITAYGNVSVEAACYGIKCISAVPFSPSSCSAFSSCSFDRPSFFNNIQSYLNSGMYGITYEPDRIALGLSLLAAYIEEDVELSSFITLSDSLIRSRRDAPKDLTHACGTSNFTNSENIFSFINTRLDKVL